MLPSGPEIGLEGVFVPSVAMDVGFVGAASLLAVALSLNARGIPTARSGEWQAATVRNVRGRAVTLSKEG